MAKETDLPGRDIPSDDLNDRIVVAAKIGISGHVPKAATDLAHKIGLPHKDAWGAGFAVKSMDGRVPMGKAVVWPIRTMKDVTDLIEDFKKAGLSDAKKRDLETFLIKQARSLEGIVLAARPGRLRNAAAVLSLFREVEIGPDNHVSYHVHVEEMIDFSADGTAGDALKQCFSLQVETDLATLAHSLKEAGHETRVELYCESNNDDTHDATSILADLMDEALTRISSHPKFATSMHGIDFEPAEYACHNN